MTEPTPARAVGCGLATLDLLYYVDGMPGENEKVTASELIVDAGGPALNAIVTARNLGVSAAIVSPIGTGATAQMIHQWLAEAQIEVTDTQPDLDSPVVSSILVNTRNGNRTVVAINGSAVADQHLPDPSVLDGATAVLVDGHHMSMALEFAAVAKSRGVPVIMDGGTWRPGATDLIRSTDFCIIASKFSLDKEKIDSLSDVANLGPRWVARTHGEGDIEFYDAAVGETVWLPVIPQNAVDTLGAGDVFHGAALAYIATHGLNSESARGSLIFASKIAGLSVSYRGAHTWAAQEPQQVL